MKSNIFSILLIIIISAGCLGPNKAKVYSPKGNDFVKILAEFKISFTQEKNIITLTHSSENIQALFKLLEVIKEKINLVSTNIANIQTTRTLEGGPYIRQYLKRDKDGNYGPVKDKREPILKYNPKHPDANKQGYVAYPDINAIEENAHLIKLQRQYNKVATIISNLEPELIL